MITKRQPPVATPPLSCNILRPAVVLEPHPCALCVTCQGSDVANAFDLVKLIETTIFERSRKICTGFRIDTQDAQRVEATPGNIRALVLDKGEGTVVPCARVRVDPRRTIGLRVVSY